MPDISVRDLPEDVHQRLRERAAANGRSMEAEVRQLIAHAVTEVDRGNLADALLQRFARTGGVELEPPERTEAPRAAPFDR